MLVPFWKVTNRYSGITTDVDSYDELPRKLGRKKSLSSSNAKIINKQMREPIFNGPSRYLQVNILVAASTILK